ncbi:flagellar hook-basal body complex protein [Selenomonas sp. AE3005]|uniref:flagellar hook-basal body complex protein n=1 Tax=Selenomonas sp. AE3005 TaxID=1485543 RepID=UPI000489B26D|nr:flagellar hook-basal body complex protein [Selenomonas sp. AE3005]
MMRSLFSGVAGLKGHQTRMDVIGNNIANVNTTGFKSSRVTFADTLNQTVSGASAPGDTIGGTNPKQIGLGVGVASIDLLFTDGSIQSTGKNTDLCLSGNGLFIVKQGSDVYYTRDGAFEFDADGNYVLPGNGMFVQGWTAKDGVLSTTGAVGNIQVKAGKSMEAAATKIATYENNLNAAMEGYEISSILVTRADGSTETVSSYAPSGVDGPTITLGTTTGKVYTLDDTADYDFTTTDSLLGKTLFTSTVSSVKANGAGQVGLTLGIGNALSSIDDGTTISIPAANIKNGTFKYGDTFPLTVKIINSAGVTTSGTDTAQTELTVDIIYPDGTAGPTGVKITVPPPANFTYQDGMTVNFDLPIEKIEANSGANITCENGNTVTLDGTDSPVNVDSSSTQYTYKGKASDGNVESVTRKEEVTSVTMNTTDGKSLPGLLEGNYTKGNTFYPSVTTTITAYGSQGRAYSIPVLYTKKDANVWALSLKGGAKSTTITDSDGKTTTVDLDATDLKFDEDGKFVSGSGNLTLKPKNGEETPTTVALNLSSLTQYAGNSTINATADGNAAGTLKSISIDSTGTITGVYTNGVKQAEAQVAVAQFTNASGLTKTGSSLYQASNNSGDANVKTATDLGVTITASALEMSNVDIANEFSDMIITQRGFQSNSKIITVGDEMLETLINMKR